MKNILFVTFAVVCFIMSLIGIYSKGSTNEVACISTFLLIVDTFVSGLVVYRYFLNKKRKKILEEKVKEKVMPTIIQSTYKVDDYVLIECDSNYPDCCISTDSDADFGYSYYTKIIRQVDISSDYSICECLLSNGVKLTAIDSSRNFEDIMIIRMLTQEEIDIYNKK